MTNGSTVASCFSPNSGGCFYLAGTGSNEISVEASSIKTVRITVAADTGKGGIFYLAGANQLISFNAATVSDVITQGYGGIIYSNPGAAGGSVTFSQFTASNFSDF